VLGLSSLLGGVSNATPAEFLSAYGVQIVETCAKCLEKLTSFSSSSSSQQRSRSPLNSYELQQLSKFVRRSPVAHVKEQLIVQDPLLNASPVQYFLTKLDESFRAQHYGSQWQQHLYRHLSPKTIQLIQSFKT
jgi:hypothetical protein